MKKLFVLIIILLFIVNGRSFAQKATLGVSGEVGIPTGNFGDGFTTGLGVLASIGYNPNPHVTLTFKSGYLSFPGNDIIATFGNYTAKVTPSWSIVPFLAGGKFYFNADAPRFYGSADLGLYLLTVSASATITSGNSTSSGTGSTNEADFGISPGFGVQFQSSEKTNVDLHLNYSTIFTSGSTASWLGLGVGLNFAL